MRGCVRNETKTAAQPTSYAEEESSIEALAGVDSEEVIQDLAFALQDEDPSLRAEVVEVFGEIGGETAIRLLEQSLHDKDALTQDTTHQPGDN